MASYEAKVSIVNKSASVTTVTYTNWDERTSRSIVIPPGRALETYNWHEPNDEAVETATTENIFNLEIEDTAPPLTKILLSNFAYEKSKVSIVIAYEASES
jgi:hypothetical protein